jgi:hypothetical protein
MTELADDRPKAPKLPRPSWLLACALEAGVVATFIAYRSIVGLLLCVAYARFSATWALAFRRDE